MKIDKSEPSYHNPTYITEGRSIFREVEANELGWKQRAGRAAWLPVGDQMLSDYIDRPAQGGASSLGFVIGIRHNGPAAAISRAPKSEAQAE